MTDWSWSQWEAALTGATAESDVDALLDELPISHDGTVELHLPPDELRDSLHRLASRFAGLRSRVGRQLEMRRVTHAISGVREPETILDRLAVEARRLLSADLAYIATGDSETRFTIRHCAGVTLTELIGTSFSPHTGLAAEVVRTGQPMQVFDYATSSVFPHGSEADDLARAEGMASLLAIPLVVRSRLGGVVCIVHRTPTEFSTADVEMGVVIADHAATCVETAALLERHADRVDHLTRLNEELTRRDRLLSDEAQWTSSVIDIVGRGGGVPEILAALSADQHDITFAAAEQRPQRCGPRVIDDDELAALVGTIESTSSQEAEHETTPLHDDLFCHHRFVSAGGQRFGMLLLVRRGPVSDEDEALLRRAAPVLALLLAAQTAAENEVWRDRGAVLYAALTSLDAPEPGALPGVRPKETYVVLFCALRPAANERGAPALPRIAAALPAVPSFADGDDLVVLCPAADVDRTTAALRSTLAGSRYAVGVSPEAAGRVDELRIAVREARRTASGLLALRMERTVADDSALGPLTHLLASAGDADAVAQAEHALRPLAALPDRRAAELRETMTAFLRHNHQMQHTADQLHIHVNTLRQRLDSITELFGHTWREPQHGLALRLALEITELSTRKRDETE